MSATKFIEDISKRRTIYALNNKLPHSKGTMSKLIKDAVRVCPSAFNVQSSRIVILYGAEHQKVWKHVKESMKAHGVAGDALAAAEAKVDNCFAAGAGTVLFYEDQDAVKAQQKQFPAYAHSFPAFSEHSSAIAQFAVWNTLAQEKVGASLQHYNELIEGRLRETFQLPASWKLIAQMPFGGIAKAPDAKTFIPDEGRFIVRGE